MFGEADIMNVDLMKVASAMQATKEFLAARDEDGAIDSEIRKEIRRLKRAEAALNWDEWKEFHNRRQEAYPWMY